MPEAVLKGEDDLLPERGGALARFAATVTSQPWTITPELGAALGLGPDALEAAAGVVAMFNYLTRVADASGIEFDYESPLPVFQPQREREAASRPDRSQWPTLGPEFRTFTAFPAMAEAWGRWREYVLDSDEPVSRRERRVLARAAAQETCDGWRAGELDDQEPRDDREELLDSFARKLSRTPWRMEPADLQALRDAGYAEPALLHVISTVALQNAESRLAMGRGLVQLP